METQSEFVAEETEQNSVAATLEKILDLQQKNSRQLVQSLRENVNFQNQVRRGMQQELDALKEQQRGEQFTPILKSIAAICVEYRTLLSDESISQNARRTLQLMFEELEDILGDYGAEIFNSNVGEPRRPLLTKIISTISTSDRDQHNTIAKSRRSGVVRNGRPLYREFVDVYVFDPDKSNSDFARTE